MCTVLLQLDQHTYDRMEALALLRQEFPDCETLNTTELLQEALRRGLDDMLGELLASTAPRGPTLHHFRLPVAG